MAVSSINIYEKFQSMFGARLSELQLTFAFSVWIIILSSSFLRQLVLILDFQEWYK